MFIVPPPPKYPHLYNANNPYGANLNYNIQKELDPNLVLNLDQALVRVGKPTSNSLHGQESTNNNGNTSSTQENANGNSTGNGNGNGNGNTTSAVGNMAFNIGSGPNKMNTLNWNVINELDLEGFNATEGSYIFHSMVCLAPPPPTPLEQTLASMNNPLAPHLLKYQHLIKACQVSCIPKFHTHSSSLNLRRAPLTGINLLRRGSPSVASEQDYDTGSNSEFESDQTNLNPNLSSSFSNWSHLKKPKTQKLNLMKINSNSNNNNNINNNSNNNNKSSKTLKPKTSILKTSSTFISKVLTIDNFSKKLQDKINKSLNEEISFFFGNIGRLINWIDLFTNFKDEASTLLRVLFSKSVITSHDIQIFYNNNNNGENSNEFSIELIIGFATGDIIWYDLINSKYSRINKNGILNKNCLLDLKWLPNSKNLIVGLFSDGSLLIFDKEKSINEDEVNYLARTPFAGIDEDEHNPNNNNNTNNGDGTTPTNGNNEASGSHNLHSPFISQVNKKRNLKYMKIYKSTQESYLFNGKSIYSNPIGYYRIGKQPLTSINFSPNGKYSSITSDDGFLRIMNIEKETLIDIFPSFFGGLLCSCWTPDGKYIITGGQDDLLSIYSFSNKKLIAYCQGHHSFIRDVKIDLKRCELNPAFESSPSPSPPPQSINGGNDNNNNNSTDVYYSYRIGSVGDDGRLLLWDFLPRTISRPKDKLSSSMNRSISVTETDVLSIYSGYRGAPSITGNTSSNNNNNTPKNIKESEEPTEVLHHFRSRKETPFIQPIMSKKVSDGPLTQVVFSDTLTSVVSSKGKIITWQRPKI